MSMIKVSLLDCFLIVYLEVQGEEAVVVIWSHNPSQYRYGDAMALKHF